MADLRRFSAAEVEAIARSRHSEIESRELTGELLAPHLEAFKFRDGNAAYWSCCPLDTAWYRFDGSGWSAAAPAPAVLEGPAYFSTVQSPVREPSNGGPTGDTDPVGGLAALIARARSEYERGLITSDQADALATDVYAVDRGARFWTIGFWSGSWYFSEHGRWAVGGAPPDPSTLIGDELAVRDCAACAEPASFGDFCMNCGGRLPQATAVPPELDAAVLEFLTAETALPEPVAAEWAAPAGHPEPSPAASTGAAAPAPFPAAATALEPVPGQVAPTPGASGTGMTCASCGARLAEGTKFCMNCGTVVPPPPPQAPAPASCASCGAAIGSARFCMQCGAPFAATPTEAEPLAAAALPQAVESGPASVDQAVLTPEIAVEEAQVAPSREGLAESVAEPVAELAAEAPAPTEEVVSASGVDPSREGAEADAPPPSAASEPEPAGPAALVLEPGDTPRAACHNCGAALTREARFCLSCGTAVTAEPPASPPAPAPAAACRNCAAALGEGARFCLTCGTPVISETPAAPAPASICGRCGASLTPGARFCLSCGSPVAHSGIDP